MPAHTIAQIAAALGAEAHGDTDLSVTGAAEPQSAGPDDLALAMDPKYADGLAAGQARAALLWPGADWQALGLKAAITVGRARMALSGLTRMLDAGPDLAEILVFGERHAGDGGADAEAAIGGLLDGHHLGDFLDVDDHAGLQHA